MKWSLKGLLNFKSKNDEIQQKLNTIDVLENKIKAMENTIKCQSILLEQFAKYICKHTRKGRK